MDIMAYGNTSGTTKVKEEELDLIDDFAAVELGGPVAAKYAEGAVEITLHRAVPRNQVKYPGQVELVPDEFFEKTFGSELKKTDYPVVLEYGKNGPLKPAPAAFYDLDYPAGMSISEKSEFRKQNWANVQEAVGSEIKSFAGRDQKPLDRDDPRARHETPGGERFRKWDYHEKDRCGDTLPDMSLRKDSKSNPWGYRLTMQPSLDPQDYVRAAEKYGKENVGLKGTDNITRSVADLEKRGRLEPQKAFHELRGDIYEYNRKLPKIVVENAGSLVSAKLLKDEDFWSKRSDFKDTHQKLINNPNKLTIGMLNKHGTYISPDFLKKTDPKRFEELRKEAGLGKNLALATKSFKADKVWRQTSENVLTPADKVRLKEGEKLGDKDLQTFSTSTKNGRSTGALKMLYATNRDQDTITPEVAKQMGVEARISPYEQKRTDFQKTGLKAKTQDAWANGGGDDSESDTAPKSNPRNTPDTLRQLDPRPPRSSASSASMDMSDS